MYDDILEKAKLLVRAIDKNHLGDLWESDLEETHSSVSYWGIKDEIDELKDAIKTTEKYLYDQDARNNPIWKELGIDPYNNRCDSPFDHLDGDYDPDAGCEWWRVWWDKEEIFVYVQIEYSIDGGRDWNAVTVDNWKSEKDTIEWLRGNGVDEDNKLSDGYIIAESYGHKEIVPFNNGFLINRELGKEQE